MDVHAPRVDSPDGGMRPFRPAGNRRQRAGANVHSPDMARGFRAPEISRRRALRPEWEERMSIWKKLREKGAAFTVETLLQAPVENAIKRYGKVNGIALENGELRLTLALNGLDREVEIRCSDIDIAEDGSSVRIGTFRSDLPCAEQALNDFATSPFTISHSGARAALVLFRKLMF